MSPNTETYRQMAYKLLQIKGVSYQQAIDHPLHGQVISAVARDIRNRHRLQAQQEFEDAKKRIQQAVRAAEKQRTAREQKRINRLYNAALGYAINVLEELLAEGGADEHFEVLDFCRAAREDLQSAIQTTPARRNHEFIN